MDDLEQQQRESSPPDERAGGEANSPWEEPDWVNPGLENDVVGEADLTSSPEVAVMNALDPFWTRGIIMPGSKTGRRPAGR